MPSRLQLLIAERKRREARAGADNEIARAFTEKMRGIVKALRADFHGPQRSFYTSKNKRRIAKTTRRSGKTSGGTRETLARCLEQPGYRVVYCNSTKPEAIRLAWRSDTRRDGWIDLLRIYGLRVGHERAKMEAGKADCFVNESEKTIEFANGSQLMLFAADDRGALDKLRGVAKHVVWVDEVQKFLHLEAFVDDVIGASMSDFEGEIWLTGTPGDFCSGYFYEATKEPDQGERTTGWEVHEWSVLDNPFFGVDRDARFRRAVLPNILGKMPRRYAGKTELWVADFLAAPPPWYQREWMGRWVMQGALFVYPVHEVPDKEGICYAPQRLQYSEPPRSPEGFVLESVNVAELGWLDVDAALEDLPKKVRLPSGKQKRITWLFAAAFDFGSNPDPFALCIQAFSPDVADIYEIWSWKQNDVHPDDQRDIIRWVLATIPKLVVCVGDPGGQKGADIRGWQERLGMDISEADKAGKRTWIQLLGAEITSGRFHYREDSPLLHEHKHLLWLVKLNAATGEAKYIEHKHRALGDKTVPGNDCSDTCLYAYRHLVYRRTEFPGWEQTLPMEVRDAREEARMEQGVDRATGMADLREDDPAAYAAGSNYSDWPNEETEQW